MKFDPTNIPEGAPHTAIVYRVIYGDTDRAGHIYHGNYPRLFEMGRGALLREYGASYHDWETAERVMLPARVCHVEYHNAAHYDDLLTIHTWLGRTTEILVNFVYRIDRGEQVLTTGYTTHVFVDSETRRPMRAGRRMLEPLGLWLGPPPRSPMG